MKRSPCPVGFVRVDPVEGRAAGVRPFLIFAFLGEEFEGAVAGVAEFEGADAGAGFDQCLGRNGGCFFLGVRRLRCPPRMLGGVARVESTSKRMIGIKRARVSFMRVVLW